MARLGVAVVRQYERGVVFRLGKLHNVRDPGMRFMIPLVDHLMKVSLRTVTMPIPSQQIITQDNVSIGVAAVAYYRRVDPVRSIIEIENVESAVGQFAQTTVRNMVGRSSLDQVLSNTEALNEAIKRVLDVTTERWGVLVQLVELKDIELPQSMQRAMAKQAEAEREKRAKIIAAEGEALSVGKLAQAADVIARSPVALQLRNLQVLSEIAVEKNSTIVFPAQFFESIRSAMEFHSHEEAVRVTSPLPDAVAPADLTAPAEGVIPAEELAPANGVAPAATAVPADTQRDGEMAVP
ncbi:SPFH domain, Band 7 family protein [Pedococcus cremeus]|uniref:SPFH domain, Band 7 family protein n=1 Tax=Pedococcus cremeus TaxID=587636 RepID=A0A1H9XLA8_9MICO|nr:slipin family protein [Pedococcus cremeus]SES46881.1 SPFH domain, Band 7 family protein [Pedococcus cremeus]